MDTREANGPNKLPASNIDGFTFNSILIQTRLVEIHAVYKLDCACLKSPAALLVSVYLIRQRGTTSK